MKYQGETPEKLPPFLPASFWQKGASIVGKVLYSFDTENGTGYAVRLVKPVEVNRNMEQTISIGALKGFLSALASAGVKELLPGDSLHLAAVGHVDTGKDSKMVRFAVQVERG